MPIKILLILFYIIIIDFILILSLTENRKNYFFILIYKFIKRILLIPRYNIWFIL